MKTKKTGKFRRFMQRAAAPLAIALVPAAVCANGPDISIDTTLSFDRNVQMRWETGTITPEFSVAPSVLTNAKAVNTLSNGARLTYGANLEVTGNGPATTNSANEIELGALLDYQRKFGAGDAWQYKVRGEVDRLVSETEWVFQRERLGLHLKYRHSPYHTTSGMIRLGYRDQNDDRLAGYDQAEFLGQLTHAWRPNKDRMTISGTVYAETRLADLDRYSYDEAGLRLMARLPVGDATEITARSSYYQRGFQDGFSPNDPTVRDDQRFKTQLEVEYDWNEKLESSVYVGWDQNESTITDMEFSDAVVGIGLTYNFR